MKTKIVIKALKILEKQLATKKLRTPLYSLQLFKDNSSNIIVKECTQEKPLISKGFNSKKQLKRFCKKVISGKITAEQIRRY